MAVTSFIPELWNARLLYNLEKAHVATALVNRNYEGEIKNMGDTVHINTISPVAVRTYTPGTPITVDGLTTTDTTLVIDQSKYFAFSVEDIDAVQAAGDLVDTASARAAYSLADTADAFLLGVIAAAGITNANKLGTDAAPITLTASNVYEKIVAMRTAMDKANVPTAGRTIAVSPDVYALLLMDDRFTKNDYSAESTVSNGFVGRVAGFDVYETNNLTAVDKSGTKSTIITAQTADAVTFAEQIIKTEAYRPEGAFADAVKGLHVYGAKAVRKECIVAMYAAV